MSLPRGSTRCAPLLDPRFRAQYDRTGDLLEDENEERCGQNTRNEPGSLHSFPSIGEYIRLRAASGELRRVAEVNLGSLKLEGKERKVVSRRCLSL